MGLTIELLGLNSIYLETIEKQYKYYTNLSSMALLACCVAREGGEGRSKVEGWSAIGHRIRGSVKAF